MVEIDTFKDKSNIYNNLSKMVVVFYSVFIYFKHKK